MARRRRYGPKSVSQHVIQRGNNRQMCFVSDSDYMAYIHWLKQYSAKFSVAIHAWVLMTNHVHLLCTPLADNNGVSHMMQSLGRQYVRFFNEKYKRTGTLWEGRFKSSLVHAPTYLLTLYQYIELNPVRANMVKDPSDYKWSSYQINALGKKSELCHPHDLYNQLGITQFERIRAYRGLFQSRIKQPLVDDIRRCANHDLVLGHNHFKAEIELMVGDKLKTNKRGRPAKIK